MFELSEKQQWLSAYPQNRFSGLNLGVSSTLSLRLFYNM